MNDDEILKLVEKPVGEFVESIKEMSMNVDKLVELYMRSVKEKKSETVTRASSDQTTPSQSDSEESQKFQPLTSAKLELAIVFAINACYWMYLVAHGSDPRGNEISKDIERVRLFMNRTREVEESLTGTCLMGKRPRIDQEASKRLCLNNMSRVK